MIGLLDALTLARTKLRSKKVLLAVTVTLAALVFGVIIAGITIVTGVTNSAETYLKSSLDNRYLVQVIPVIPDTVSGITSRNTVPSDSLKKTLLTLQDQYITQQKALAKQYNVPFDSSTIPLIIQPSPLGIKDSSTGQLQQVINTSSPVWATYVNQLQTDWLKTTKNKLSDLKVTTEKYGATAYYQNVYGSISYLTAQYLTGGKEDVTKYGQMPAYDPSTPAVTAVQGSAYVFTDQSLVQRFILPKNTKRQQDNKGIPVVITSKEATTLFGDQLGINKEPSDAAGQIAWMKNLQDKVNGQTYQVCYRSQGELSLIQQITQQNIESGTQTKDNPYTLPALTYKLPTTSCGNLPVKEDNRTAAEKQTEANQEAYQKANGTYQPVTSQLLTFQVVGVMSIVSNSGTTYKDIPSFVNGLLGVNFSSGAFIPNQLYSKLPVADQHKDILQNFNGGIAGYNNQAFIDAGVGQTIVAFPSIQQAQDFINTDTCYTMDTNTCSKLWSSQIYGSNYLLIGDFGKLIASIARVALPIALILAVIIIWITMARVIIDSRRETAVFRALGAKRGDIMRIYISYSLIVALFVALLALIIGGIGAVVIEVLYGSQATNYAKVAYGVFDQLQPFSFIGIDIGLIGRIILAILVVSFIAVLPPLIRNVRRNPIRDMRDDS